MRLAVLKYQYVSNPLSIPDEWPSEVIEIGDSDPAPGEDWVIMTMAEFADHKATHQEDYNTWLATQSSPVTSVKAKIQAAMDFGRDLMAEYGAKNVVAGKTTVQIELILNTTANVKAALDTGSLYVALEKLADIEPDGITITASEISDFRNKIQDYLEMPRT